MIYMYVPYMVGFLQSTLIKTIVIITCFSYVLMVLNNYLSFFASVKVLMQDMSRHPSLQGKWIFSKRSLFSFQYVEGIKKFMIIIVIASFISISFCYFGIMLQ